jgi:hypothetical protein
MENAGVLVRQPRPLQGYIIDDFKRAWCILLKRTLASKKVHLARPWRCFHDTSKVILWGFLGAKVAFEC